MEDTCLCVSARPIKSVGSHSFCLELAAGLLGVMGDWEDVRWRHVDSVRSCRPYMKSTVVLSVFRSNSLL